MLKKALVVLVMSTVIVASQLAIQAAPVYYSGNGSYYELLDSQTTWWDANTAASGLSYAGRPGHLATITSADENQFILDTFSPHQVPYGFWLGANDVAVEGEWRWVTGPEAGTLFSLGRTSVGYTFWGSNEPTNWNGIEHFLVFDAEGGSGLPEWDDKPFDYTQNYLVEYSVPEPATMGLLVIGGLALLRRKSKKSAGAIND
ncbi:MAG: PEP-CTERM sorting domain-containing protein [Phycisphaerae bacterium]|nr:PEP-CTERM sorting domain-containing protein [Phycisphaerae bacterium]